MKEFSFEAIKTFVTLAELRTMAATVQKLSVTRQTVRRHVTELEQLAGCKLIRVGRNSYDLTDAGTRILDAARDATDQMQLCEDLIKSPQREYTGLDHSVMKDETACNIDFRSQQHPLDRLWVDGPSLLQDGFLAWANARFQLEHPAMERIKPFLMVYRRHTDGWICSHIGERSSCATWFGQEWASSSIGSLSRDDPIGSRYDQFATKSYERAYRAGGARVDHVYAKFQRRHGQMPVPVRFQRLLFKCYFPDMSSALGLLVVRTNEIAISGLDLSSVPELSDDLLMDQNVIRVQ